MTRPLTLMLLVAAAALAGCNNEDHTIVAGPGADDEPMNNVGVVLPPSIQASKAYRCKDNSLIYVDWLSDGTARVKKTREEVGTTLPVGDKSLTGDAKAASITYNGQSCKA
jgi:predicted small secreted protein